MTALWVDAFGGLSGDLWIAGLVGLGADPEALRRILKGFPFAGLDLRCAKVMRCGIQAHRAEVMVGGRIDDGSEPHLRLTGTRFKAQRRPVVTQVATWKDVDALLKAHLTGSAADRARDAFHRLGTAEARIHGTTLDQVHFHEVGNQDSIADVALAASAWQLLGEPEVHVGPVATGTGQTRMAHGVYPIPSPATLLLLEGFELVPGQAPHGKELTTPTGAALAAALATTRQAPARFIPAASAFAAGSYDFATTPAVSRFILGHLPARESVMQVEVNVDDATPQQVAHAQARMMEDGALDVWVTPATFKKGRSGWVIGALVLPARMEAVTQRLTQELPVLGYRQWPVQRQEAERSFHTETVAGQSLAIKTGTWPTARHQQPEFDDAARIARAAERPLKDVQDPSLRS